VFSEKKAWAELWVSPLFSGEPPTLSKGMPYFFRMEGEINVILWRRNASQPLKLLGKKPDKHTWKKGGKKEQKSTHLNRDTPSRRQTLHHQVGYLDTLRPLDSSETKPVFFL